MPRQDLPRVVAPKEAEYLSSCKARSSVAQRGLRWRRLNGRSAVSKARASVNVHGRVVSRASGRYRNRRNGGDALPPVSFRTLTAVCTITRNFLHSITLNIMGWVAQSSQKILHAVGAYVAPAAPRKASGANDASLWLHHMSILRL